MTRPIGCCTDTLGRETSYLFQRRSEVVLLYWAGDEVEGTRPHHLNHQVSGLGGPSDENGRIQGGAGQVFDSRGRAIAIPPLLQGNFDDHNIRSVGRSGMQGLLDIVGIAHYHGCSAGEDMLQANT